MRTKPATLAILTFLVLLTLLVPAQLQGARSVADTAHAAPAPSLASGPASSPWPVYQHDARRTSRSPYTGPVDPYLKWHYAIAPSAGSAPAIGPDGTIYAGGNDNQLHAINPDGTYKWSFGMPSVIWSSPAVAADGTIYVGHNGYSDGNLMAINPDGTPKWAYPAREVRSSPNIALDGTIYVGASDARLYAINPDGTLKWKYRSGFAEAYSAPAIATDGTIYIAGTKERNLHAVNPDGTTQWTYPIGTLNDTTSTPTIDSDGTIYIGGTDNKLYALNPDGTLKWSYPAGDLRSSSQSVAIGPDGTLYMMPASGDLLALNPDGTYKWAYTFAAGTTRTTPTVDAAGAIYAGAADGKVYAINPNGTLKWAFQTPSTSLGSVVAIDDDGTLYIGGQGGVYAIGDQASPTHGAIAGTVTSAVGGLGLGGVKVSAGGYTATTAANGSYLLSLPEGAYVVEALPGAAGSYYANRLTGVEVEVGSTTEVNLKLTPITPDTVDTLIVANFQRMKDIGYDSATVDVLAARVDALMAADPNDTNMTAVLVDLGAVTAAQAVKDAYAAWDGREGDVALTNALVAAIDAEIEDLEAAAYPNLAYVILIGSHEVIPMQARPSHLHAEDAWAGRLPQQSGYLYDLYADTTGGARGHFQTDAPYRDLSTAAAAQCHGCEQGLIPELAVGRLVETPEQIAGLIDTYLASDATFSTDGMASVGSVDYMDSATLAASYMTQPATTIERDFASFKVPVRLSSNYNDVVYLGGHGSYNWLTTDPDPPPQWFMSGVTTTHACMADVTGDLADAVIVSTACHHGVNLGNRLYHAPDGTTSRWADFPEAYAEQGAGVFLATTGYASISASGTITDDYQVVLNELVATHFIKYLLQTQPAVAGDALTSAINDYVAHLNGWGAWDAYTLATVTFYGIPNYRSAAPDAAALSQLPADPSPRTALPQLPANPSPRTMPGLNSVQGGIVQRQVTVNIKDWSVDGSGVVRVPGAAYGTEIDQPVLPVVVLKSVLPAGSGIKTVVWEESASEKVSLPNAVPLPVYATTDLTGTGAIAEAGTFTYTGFFPPKRAYTSTVPGGGDAVDSALQVMPVAYDQVTEQTEIWTKLVFDVTYEVAPDKDTDGDGMADHWESYYRLDIFNDSGDSGAAADIDGDGLSNLEECQYGTHPRLSDTDGDGLADSVELAYGSDPTNYFSKANPIPLFGYSIYLPMACR